MNEFVNGDVFNFIWALATGAAAMNLFSALNLPENVKHDRMHQRFILPPIFIGISVGFLKLTTVGTASGINDPHLALIVNLVGALIGLTISIAVTIWWARDTRHWCKCH